MKKGKKNSLFKKFWKFYWEEESILSYIFFFIITYVLLKFVAFPAFLFCTGLSDVTAVMTGSMIHGDSINQTYYAWMAEKNHTVQEIKNYPFSSGINIGEVVFVKRIRGPDEIEVGDVIVFYSPSGKSIIHRVVNKRNGLVTTKGDANTRSDYYEHDIPFEDVKGKAIFKIPLLGYPRVLLGRMGV